MAVYSRHTAHNTQSPAITGGPASSTRRRAPRALGLHLYHLRIGTVRDIAIIALLALGVAFVPGGGNAAQAAIAVLVIAFLVTIGFAARQLYRENRLTISSLPDRERAILYAGVGLIVLMIAGADSLLDSAAGTLVWVGLLALGIIVVARVWVEANRF